MPGEESERPAEFDSDAEQVSMDERFASAADTFEADVDAIRDMHEGLAPAAMEMDDIKKVFRMPAEISWTLTEDDRKLIGHALLPEEDVSLAKRDVVDRIWTAVRDEPWGAEFTYRFFDASSRPKRAPIFHGATLSMVVSTFEAHLAKLAELYYRAAPAALHDVPKDSTKEFSLRDLQNMGSIDDAIELAIESRVTGLMFGNLATWRKFFKDRTNLDMQDLAESWPAVVEVLERRHCVIHHEGRASRRYAASVESATLGDDLSVDAGYVRNAIDILETLALRLHFGLWAKFGEDEQVLARALESIAFTALKDGLNAVSLALWLTLADSALDEYMVRSVKVNIFLARKGIAGLDPIRDEVEAWDVSGSDDIFTFAKACVLDDLDTAFGMLPDLLAREKLLPRSLASWPLTESLRSDERIGPFRSVMGETLSAEADLEDEQTANQA